MNNKLYIGDNLEIMRSLPNESVDLIATDPPFYSRKNYQEFDDRWSSLEEFIEFMRLRLIEMHRLLKPTGSIYLHLNQSASHYIKIEMDKIFGTDQFVNDIIWTYAVNGRPPKYGFPKKHDNILFYRKSSISTFNRLYQDIPKDAYKKFSKTDEDGRKYKVYTKAHAKKKYLDEYKGIPIPSYWTDIISFSSCAQSKERTGYPTQKPIKIYNRIIKASSNEGDLVLDPFAGSGTTLDAAQSLNRCWIGIDKNPNAVNYIKKRFDDRYGLLNPNYEVIHE